MLVAVNQGDEKKPVNAPPPPPTPDPNDAKTLAELGAAMFGDGFDGKQVSLKGILDPKNFQCNNNPPLKQGGLISTQRTVTEEHANGKAPSLDSQPVILYCKPKRQRDSIIPPSKKPYLASEAKFKYTASSPKDKDVYGNDVFVRAYFFEFSIYFDRYDKEKIRVFTYAIEDWPLGSDYSASPEDPHGTGLDYPEHRRQCWRVVGLLQLVRIPSMAGQPWLGHISDEFSLKAGSDTWMKVTNPNDRNPPSDTKPILTAGGKELVGWFVSDLEHAHFGDDGQGSVPDKPKPDESGPGKKDGGGKTDGGKGGGVASGGGGGGPVTYAMPSVLESSTRFRERPPTSDPEGRLTPTPDPERGDRGKSSLEA